MLSHLARKRLLYSTCMIVSILAGLISRSGYFNLPEFLDLYLGDTIWGFMVFWWTCALFPASKNTHKLGIALLFSFLIEFSQLYHAPWIDSIRNIKLAALILGYGFKFSDLICYSVGILTAFLIELLASLYFCSEKLNR